MKSLVFVVATALLLGCSGNSVETSTTGNATGGTGGATTGGGAGEGGIGGFGSSSSGGTTTTTMCAVVLDESFAIDLVVDGQTSTLFSSCSDADGQGPQAQLFQSKGGDQTFQIQGCNAPDGAPPSLRLGIAAPGVGDTVASIEYTDGAGNLTTAEMGSAHFNSFGEPWDLVTGTFEGTAVAPDDGTIALSGSFFLCRQPDVFAP